MIAQGTDAAAQGQEAEDLAGLYDVHAALLYRYALSIVDCRDDAQDVVHDVFLGLLRHGQLRRIRDMRRYLLRAARNQALMLLRRSRRECSLDERWVDVSALEPDQMGLAADLEAALRALPIKQREVVILKVVGGLSFREIAKVVGAPQNTVATRHRTALGKLKAALAGERDG